MADFDQYIASEAYIKFRRAKHLTDVDAKSDPETEPYKSLYEARQIWAEIKSDLESLGSCDSDLYRASLAAVFYYIGANFTDSDETSSGEDNLRKCVELIEPIGLSEKTCNVLQNAYNYTAILWSNRRQANKALEYLIKAEKLYSDYKHDIGSAPFFIDELLDPLPDDLRAQKRQSALEEAYTKTTYYLAQVYTSLEENDAAARYCHFTLKRQLDGKYDVLEWALNCATLSQYYLPDNMAAARHCLASASLIIQQAEPDEKDTEKVPRAIADVQRCWGKYALSLLDESKEKLYESLDTTNDNEPQENDKEMDRFDLETDRFEEQITDKHLLVFNDAKSVFLFGQQKLKEALKFYTINDFCTDHVEIQQDLSKLYRGLAFFEESMDRQCKMEKRRIDLLTPLLEQVNQQFYLLVCRQLMYEIAEVYSNMVDLKLALMEKTKATLHSAAKLNFLVRESISHYDKYTHSFNNPDGKIPENLEENDIRPMLMAFFCTGRLFSKFIPQNTEERVRNLEQSVDRYRCVVVFCDKKEKAADLIKSELELCREMVNLLPLKIVEIKCGNM